MHAVGRFLAHPSVVLPRAAYVAAWLLAVAVALAGGIASIDGSAWTLTLLALVPVVWLAAEHLLRGDDLPVGGEGPWGPP